MKLKVFRCWLYRINCQGRYEPNTQRNWMVRKSLIKVPPGFSSGRSRPTFSDSWKCAIGTGHWYNPCADNVRYAYTS
jgi:hypothetical protein